MDDFNLKKYLVENKITKQSQLCENEENLNISDVRSGDFERYYKWIIGNDIYCARVVNTTANYYKNGKIYAEYQQFIPRDTDIQISKKEFDSLIGI
jgi:hypothetical protein